MIRRLISHALLSITISVSIGFFVQVYMQTRWMMANVDYTTAYRVVWALLREFLR